MIKQTRNHTFDFLCGICIIRMIVLHIILSIGESEVDWWKNIMYWCFFFMSFFFFKAGYFNKSVGGSTKEFLKDKAKHLLLPWLSWGIIGNLLYFAFIPALENRYGDAYFTYKIESLWANAGFVGNGPCWFLLSFFTTYMIVHLLEKKKGLHWVVLSFPFVSWALYLHSNPLFMNLNSVFLGVFFFYLGHAWHYIMNRIRRKKVFILSALLLVAFIVCNVLLHGTFDFQTNSMREGDYMGAVVSTVLVLTGFSGLLLKLPLHRVPVINYIGQHSMVYFVSHYPIIWFYKNLHLLTGRSIWHHWEESVILAILIFSFCTWIVPYVEKIPFLSGRFPSK